VPKVSWERDMGRGKNGFEVVFGCLNGTFGWKGTVVVGVGEMELNGGGGVGEQVEEGLGFFVIYSHTGKGVATGLKILKGKGKRLKIGGRGAVGLGFKVDISFVLCD
jgi:hypothetical protein